jgi:hypothetical protein
MAQTQSIPSGIRSVTASAPDETLNTPTQDTQLQRRAQNPHRPAADMATKNMHNDQKLRILRKCTAKMNNPKHAVGCKLLNHIKQLPTNAI